MNPGRELDALVAEKVMGLEGVRRRPIDGEHIFTEWLKDSSGNEVSDATHSLVPCYSTDIAAAWEIVEKLGLSVINWHGGWSAGIAEVEEERGEDDRLVGSIVGLRDDSTEHGLTAPHAICLAALARVAKP